MGDSSTVPPRTLHCVRLGLPGGRCSLQIRGVFLFTQVLAPCRLSRASPLESGGPPMLDGCGCHVALQFLRDFLAQE